MTAAIIFDLDGTLLDTSAGIFHSVRYAEKELGLTPIPEADLKKFVGPPPKEMYREIYGLNEQKALAAAKKHREYGASRAVYEAKVYDGMEEVLCRLRQEGFKLGVATLKKQSIAEAVLKNFSLYAYFDQIVGMDEDESYTKCMTIQKAMKNMSAQKAVIVGDSLYDFMGAQEAGTAFIGVLYGFGFKEGESYPFKSISMPAELPALLIPEKETSGEIYG
ncbi:MAG: HAD-IA family hydrolase [Lachnospiraceae bacterium]|nr:HAD-IA family hydrolase [Lachnospiraceae bacterium]